MVLGTEKKCHPNAACYPKIFFQFFPLYSSPFSFCSSFPSYSSYDIHYTKLNHSHTLIYSPHPRPCPLLGVTFPTALTFPYSIKIITWYATAQAFAMPQFAGNHSLPADSWGHCRLGISIRIDCTKWEQRRGEAWRLLRGTGVSVNASLML